MLDDSAAVGNKVHLVLASNTSSRLSTEKKTKSLAGCGEAPF